VTWFLLACTSASPPRHPELADLGSLPLPEIGAEIDPGTTDTSVGGTGTGTAIPTWLAPDFTLVDQNESSPTYGQAISPRSYLGHATGWYFVHTT
jgi:hypothetical protein